MKRDWLERFIQIGTSEMYGSVGHAANEDEPIKPTSPYAASKVAFDMYLISVHKFLKFPMNIIRPSNAYCPGQLLHRVIPKAVMCGLTGDKLPLHGGGKRRKIVYPRPRSRRAPSTSSRKRRRWERSTMPARQSRPRSAKSSNVTAKALGMPFEQLVRSDRRSARAGLALLARFVSASSAISAGSRRSAGMKGSPRWSHGAANTFRR